MMADDEKKSLFENIERVIALTSNLTILGYGGYQVATKILKNREEILGYLSIEKPEQLGKIIKAYGELISEIRDLRGKVEALENKINYK